MGLEKGNQALPDQARCNQVSRPALPRARVLATALTLSAAGFATWMGSEGFTSTAVIPTKGDVPTIGYGSTRYEDGTRVKLGDTITRQRAEQLARNLLRKDEQALAKSIPGVPLYQEEFDLYLDFIGQYGITNWNNSTMRRELLARDYVAACSALLRYKYAAGYDCSTPGNQRCWGVWQRQLKRYSDCMQAQK